MTFADCRLHEGLNSTLISLNSIKVACLRLAIDNKILQSANVIHYTQMSPSRNRNSLAVKINMVELSYIYVAHF